MKLIIENLDGEFFVYRETEKIFRHNEIDRSFRGKRKNVKILDDECHLRNSSLRKGNYIVITIGKEK